MRADVSCLVLLLSSAYCWCHLCLLSPPQRGSLQGVNTAGSPDCLLTQEPCGARVPAANSVILRPGQNFTMVFQKNLDHYVAATPGYFNISLLNEKTNASTLLAVVPDRGEPSLHLYSYNVTIPAGTAKQDYALQAIYVTRNPQAPAMFFQCADVTVFDVGHTLYFNKRKHSLR